MSVNGIIMKALSGFYYVLSDGKTFECRARGKMRLEKVSPLAGDSVLIKPTENGKGVLEEVLPRKNSFIRPAVANIDQMVIIASETIPVTDPFLIDRIIAVAEIKGCEPLIVINKCDISDDSRLYDIYIAAGFTALKISAATGVGLPALAEALKGKSSVFTGNSGVGKSSILNALEDFHIETGEVSKKLGRGRHTTRHVELYRLRNSAIIADTPGFASFDYDEELGYKGDLQYKFRDFKPFLDSCRYRDCAHTKEQGCAVIEAVGSGKIQSTRHESYLRLYEQLKLKKEWEIKK